MGVASPAATVHRDAPLPNTFMGFPRAAGRPGIRNLVVILPVVAGAHVVAQRIATRVPGTVAVPYLDDGVSGREDEVMTDRVLIGAAAGPNVAAVLLVNLADDGRDGRYSMPFRAPSVTSFR